MLHLFFLLICIFMLKTQINPFPFNLCLYIKILFLAVGRRFFSFVLYLFFNLVTSAFMWLLFISYFPHLPLYPFPSFLPCFGLVSCFLLHFILCMGLFVTDHCKHFQWWFYGLSYITGHIKPLCMKYKNFRRIYFHFSLSYLSIIIIVMHFTSSYAISPNNIF